MAFKLAEAFIEMRVAGMETVRANIDGLRGNLNRLGQVNFSGGVTSGMARIQSAMSSLKAAATGLPAIISIGAGVALGKHMVDLAMEMEQATVSFKVMLGSAAAAKKLMGEIMQFAAATPYESPEVVNATKSLIAFGSSASTVIGEVRRLGDIASGVGMPIGELAQIYGKARVQGRLFGEDINQMTGRGIPIIGEIAKQLQISESEVRKAVEKGNVNFSTIETAFKNLTDEGGRFHGMMEEQSKTMKGIASTAQDDLNAALRETGNILGTAIVPKLAEAATLVKDISKLALPGDAKPADEGPSVADVRGSSKSDLAAMEAKAKQEREQRFKALQEARAAAVQHGQDTQARARNPLIGPIAATAYGTIQRGFDDKKIAEAEQALQEVDGQLTQIRTQMSFIDEYGKGAMDDGIAKPAGLAKQAVETLRDKINETVKLLARGDNGAMTRAFGSGKEVKEGELGFIENKEAIKAAAKAAQQYELQLENLQLRLRTGVIDKGDFDKQSAQAKAAKEAAEAAVHAPQFRTGGELRGAAKSNFQKELDRIGTLRKLNSMTAAEAQQAGDKARATLQKQLADIKKMEARALSKSLANQFDETMQLAGDSIESILSGGQHNNPIAERAAAEAKKIGEQHRTPMQEYQARMKELNQLRDKGGFKGHEEDYQRASKAARRDLDAALGYKPEFRTKKGQLAEEQRQYEERLADLDRQKGLDDGARNKLRDRIDNAHSNRLADIEEQHAKPKVETHGLTDFAKHIQQGLSQNPAEARREKRETQMVDQLTKINAGIDKLAKVKQGPARFGKGP